MFDMPKWSNYLDEYCENAMKEGATEVDILELFYLRMGILLPRIKVQELRRNDGE